MSTSVDPAVALTALDRCDRCGAQAYVRVTLTSGSELMFCGHHFTEFKPRLEAMDVTVHDESAKLSGTATPAPDER